MPFRRSSRSEALTYKQLKALVAKDFATIEELAAAARDEFVEDQVVAFNDILVAIENLRQDLRRLDPDAARELD